MDKKYNRDQPRDSDSREENKGRFSDKTNQTQRDERPFDRPKKDSSNRQFEGNKERFGDRPRISTRGSSENFSRPRTESSRDDKPRFSRENSDPNRKDGPRYGDKSSYGDRSKYGDKPSYSDKSRFGDRPNYGDKPKFGDRPKFTENNNSEFKRNYREDEKFPTKDKYDRVFKEKAGLIYGIRPIMEALRQKKDMDTLYVQNGLTSDHVNELISRAKENLVSIKYVPAEKIEKFTRNNHQGVAAFISPVKILKTEDLLPELLQQEKFLLLILDRITDTRNFGAICRTAEAMGVAAIIIPDGGAAPVNEDAMRTSTGAILNLKICKSTNLCHTLDYLQENGVVVFAATEKAAQTLQDVEFQSFSAIVLGNEEQGIGKDILRRADHLVKIPMQGETGALNVSVAAGILMYEYFR